MFVPAVRKTVIWSLFCKWSTLVCMWRYGIDLGDINWIESSKATKFVAFLNRPAKLLNFYPHQRTEYIGLWSREGVVYEIPCASWRLSYVSEAKRFFATRLREHQEDIRNNCPKSTALAQHAIQLNHVMDWDNSKILADEDYWHKRKFMESFFINNKPNTINARNSV